MIKDMSKYPKSVLFLDVDGVLNARMTRIVSPKGRDQIDEDKVARINRVVELTGCSIVVSSTWRLKESENDVPIERLRRVLGEVGAKFDILGITPRFSVCPAEPPCSSFYDMEHCLRGHEIQDWMDGALFRGPFAIVDDDTDMAHLAHKLVKTHDDIGIQDEHVEMLCNMLKEIV